ncbi:MAG: sulfite exporter TauE/SafE family protein [Syntrophobacteraceae bacterium]|nr:sulfite exporter TauE/SafE family protein [Desulfobacteraceae bacterium]
MVPKLSAGRRVLMFWAAFTVLVLIVSSGAWAQDRPVAPSQPPAAGQSAGTEQKPPEVKPKAVGNNLGLPGKLGQELAKAPEGKGKGQIDPNAPRGVFGIPGAVQVSSLLAFLWATWVGWIFSTVGAFGGVMAGVGHMTIYGLGDYVRTFKDTAPGLNKTLTDSLRTSNQFLVGLSSIISVINYLKSRRMSWPLGLALGVGSIVGAYLAASLSAGKVSFSQYQGWFGVFVLVVGAVLIYELTPAGQAGKKKTKEAAQAFERTVREKSDIAAAGVTLKSFSVTNSTMTFFGTDFSFNPIAAFFGGVIIAAISAFIGVGGGFLYVPYLTSIVGLPMFVVAGTSALAVFISMITSIATYISVAGAGMDWALVGTQLVGVFVGSVIGPRTAKYIPDKWLKLIFIVLALYVGLGYFSKGFFGQAWVPM